MLLADVSQYFFGITIFVLSIFLILLVLVQRGRGGGLAGALGGPGGQSAFGTKAGDLFTRITIGVATAWIFLCAASVFFLKPPKLPSTGIKTSSSIGSVADESDKTLTPPATGTAETPAADTGSTSVDAEVSSESFDGAPDSGSDAADAGSDTPGADEPSGAAEPASTASDSGN